MSPRPAVPRRRARGLAGLALLGAAGAVVAGLTGCSTKLGYAAVVNGTSISQAKLNQELSDIAANKMYVTLINQPGGSGPVAGSTAGTYNKSFVALLLDQQIRFEIIRQQLVSAHALPTAAEVTMAKTPVSQLFPTGVYDAFPARYQTLLASQQAEADSFVKAITAALPGDALAQFYQSHPGDYATENCVSHILIADKDSTGQLDYASSLTDANKVKGLIQNGGDFASLAKQYSQDNQGANGGSAGQGGALTGNAADGCLTNQDLQGLVPEFAKAVEVLPLNQVSDPVKSQFGYHLIVVTKRTLQPLDDSTVMQDIRQRLAGDRLNRLVAQAKVKINPEFGTFSGTPNSSGAVAGVVPPLVPNLTGTTTSTTAAPASSGG